MNALTLVLLMLATTTSNAQEKTTKLNCLFTEPFFNLQINVKNSKKITVTKIEPDFSNEKGGNKTTVLFEDGVIATNFKDLLVPTFSIKSRKTTHIIALTLTGHGSDGMSDFIFPYEIAYQANSKEVAFWGGCESNVLKRQGSDGGN